MEERTKTGDGSRSHGSIVVSALQRQREHRRHAQNDSLGWAGQLHYIQHSEQEGSNRQGANQNITVVRIVFGVMHVFALVESWNTDNMGKYAQHDVFCTHICMLQFLFREFLPNSSKTPFSVSSAIRVDLHRASCANQSTVLRPFLPDWAMDGSGEASPRDRPASHCTSTS